MGGACSTYGGTGAYMVLVGKPEGKGQLGRPRRSWEDNIKWIFKKWNGGIDWIDLARGKGAWRALVNAAMNFRVNFLTSCGPVSVLKSVVLHGVS